MSDIISLEAYRLTRDASTTLAEVRRDAEERIDAIASVDVSALNGKDLRKLKDTLLRFKWIRAILDPEVQRSVNAMVEQNGREPTPEEIKSFVPYPPRVQLI